MNIPKYVIDMMERATYNYETGDTGYTINIRKATPYTKIGTLKDETEKLVRWANRQVPQFEGMPTARIDRIPEKTHYCNQSAIVTIYDPVMQHIEHFIRAK